MKTIILAYLIFIAIITMNAQSGLIRHYRLDGDAIESTSGIDGTLMGTHSTSADEIAAASGAISFDGLSGYLEIPAAGLTALNEFTYSICVRVNAAIPTGTAWSILSIGSSTKDQVVYLSNGGPGGQNGFGFGTYNNAFTAADDVWTGSLPAVGQWYHITAVRSVDQYKLYVDDILIDSLNTSNPNAGYGTSPTARLAARSGTSWGVQFFNGQIEDFKIFNRALANSEVSNLCSSSTVAVADINASKCFPSINRDHLEKGVISLNSSECRIEQFKFTVYDLIGNQLYSSNDISASWPIGSNLAPNIYLYSIEGTVDGKYYSMRDRFYWNK